MGGALLWLATLAIVTQVFANLVIVRYALYCGEPLLVGALRTRPGAGFWICCYLLLDLAAIWPYNAYNAAVPLVAAMRGALPEPGDWLVKFMGYVLYFAAFVPLIFGGTVYRMLEKVMAIKLVYVLGYLLIVAVFMVSWPVIEEVAAGFVKIGTVPIRAETVVSGGHFVMTEHVGADRYTVKGTDGKVFEFRRNGQKLDGELTGELHAIRDALGARAMAAARPGHFLVGQAQGNVTLSVEGTIGPGQVWKPEKVTIQDGARVKVYDSVEVAPQAYRDRLADLARHKGSEHANIVTYIGKHGRLPDLDWATLATFCAFAGAGGLTNAMLANWARDKGWGMGKRVGAIPSAVAGRTIPLSPAGKVFPADEANMNRWRGWLRHVLRDQVGLWMVASFIGMALPCMLSLEFIRNATAQGDRVAAMTADGMAARYPAHSGLLWTMTLLCGFMILWPGQVSLGDQVSRRWTDIIWSISPRVRALGHGRVKNVYYTILAVFCLWGIIPLALFNPMQTAKISGFLSNLAMAFSALLAIYVNRVLMPRGMRAPLLMQAGSFLCFVFYFGISMIVFIYTFL